MKDIYTKELFPEAIVKTKRYIPEKNDNVCTGCKKNIGVLHDKMDTGTWYKCKLHGIIRGASLCEDREQ